MDWDKLPEPRQPKPNFSKDIKQDGYLTEKQHDPGFDMGAGVPWYVRLWISTKRFMSTGITTAGATFVVTGDWRKAIVAGLAAGSVGGGEKYAKETAKGNGKVWVGLLDGLLKLIVKLVQAWNERRKREKV